MKNKDTRVRFIENRKTSVIVITYNDGEFLKDHYHQLSIKAKNLLRLL